jgi:TRAP-type C4-dicarboxylate transport system substrate-binding protein
MKRRAFIAALPAAAAATAATTVASREARAQQTRWQIATAYPDSNFHTQNIRQFIADIEHATNGRLSIQLHSGASLLPMLQIKRAVRSGQIQMGEIALSAYGNEDPFFEVDTIPFLAETWQKSFALDAVSEPIVRARLERQGIGLLYTVQWPSQGFYTRTELNRLEDLRGSRFRAQTTPLNRLAEAMGAVPVLVQQAEVPQAFATGIINAMLTSAASGVDTAAWDFSRYFTDVGGMFTRNAVLVNVRAFDTLDERTRAAVREAAMTAQRRGREASQASEKVLTERLRTQGMIVREPSPELMAQLRTVGERLTQEWATRAGGEGQEMLRRYQAALAR